MNTHPQTGSMLLLVGVMMMLLTGIALSIAQREVANHHAHSLLENPRSERDSNIRSITPQNLQPCVDASIHQLRAYLSIQGYSNPGQFGRLPYPMKQTPIPGGFIGELPVFSQLTGSGMRHGLGSTHPLIKLDPSCQDRLIYAVATIATNDVDLATLQRGDEQQVLNDGGGDWWSSVPSAASLTFLTSDITTKVVAIVAEGLTVNRAGQWQPQGAHGTISISAWQTMLAHKASVLFSNTVQRSMQTKTGRSSPPQALPRNGCSCECTRSRCRCQCEEGDEIWWQSTQPGSQCLASSTGQCRHSLNANQARCSAQPGDWCDFNAAASLVSDWPITRWQPQSHSSSACAQDLNSNAGYSCPLAAAGKTSPCRCEFDWPISLQSQNPDRLTRLISHLPSVYQ